MGNQILVVEDNEHLRGILASLLTHYGYEPLLAGNGAEAIETAISSPPDVVLLDLGLPDMSGNHVAETILKQPGFARLPIIGCSAYSADDEKEKALRAGMVGYLQKPVRAEQLREALETYCSPNGKSSAARESTQRICLRCDSRNVRASGHSNCFEKILALAAIRPFRCRDCYYRFWSIGRA